MAKLYPPYIEGTIPAFTGGEIIVPFSMNRAVSKYEIAGFSLRIKTVQNNTFIATINSTQYDLDAMEAYFDVNAYNKELLDKGLTESDTIKFTVGQFYKLQMAYIDKQRQIGYYSTVGVIKCTSEPEIYIEDMVFPGVNNHDHGYIGVYRQKDDTGEILKDITEKVYTYHFTVQDNKGLVVFDSGELLHNATEDTVNYQSNDYYEITDDLKIGESYYLKYSITTINGLKRSSKKYRIVQRESIAPDLDAHIEAEMNFSEGYVDINLIGHLNKEGIEEPVVGAFLLARANKKTPSDWENLKRFSLQSELATGLIFRDCTVAQGETYIYSLQQYNDSGLYSNRLLSNEVYADFEDAFLYDGKKQLKIKYNPKVSSFKNTILETKVDTIGSKHPFIFRNGKVKYKDFSISGLISYFMDEAEMFMREQDYMLQEKTTNLISPNQASERLFKLEVLDWLSNGEAKIFRSPGEGNYLVRLMNVSLTPIDTVGRMLHSFNCNAYEVADCTYENLCKFNIIKLEDLDNTRLRWATIEFCERMQNGQLSYKSGEMLIKPNDPNQTYIAKTVEFRDMFPGDYFYLNAPNPKNMTETELLPYKITIGQTGSYRIDNMQDITSIWIVPMGNKIKEPYLLDENGDYILDKMGNKQLDPTQKTVWGLGNDLGYVGSVTFSYYGNYENSFSMIANVDMLDVPSKQIIGEQWIEKTFIDDFSGEEYIEPVNNNVIVQLEDIKTNILKIFALRFEKRPIEYIYVKSPEMLAIEYTGTISGYPELALEGSYLYFDRACTEQFRVHKEDFKPYVMYQVRDAGYDYNNEHNDTHYPADENFHRGEYYYIDRDHDKYYPTLGSYIDGKTLEVIPEDLYSTTFYYNLGVDHFKQDTNLDKYYGIDLAQTEQYDMYDIEDFHDIILTSGAMVTLSYQAQILEYLLENSEPFVLEAKDNYQLQKTMYNMKIKELEQLDETSPDFEDKNNLILAQLAQMEQDINVAYQDYIETLEIAIMNYKEANAIPYEKSNVR